MPYLIFVLYDSITNSIFEGQIAQPLLQRKKINPTQKIIIISYEKNCLDPLLQEIANHHLALTFIFLKKIPFITPTTFYPAIKKLHILLKLYPNYTLIARGPLAGYICLKATAKTNCLDMIIQARGALKEEYCYATKNTKNFFIANLQKWRIQQFKNIESLVYKKQAFFNFPITIETVSNSLKDYLINFYNADPQSIIIANQDIPQKIKPETILQWRKEVRMELALDNKIHVYCYNGSIKPWQCPQETIAYFKQQLKINNNNFLLVLTQDKHAFEHIMHKENISSHHYSILTVSHQNIYRYLAACDTGLIFREKTTMNWVSRPTKVLEYQALGLSIVHNNTIALLHEQRDN